LPQESKKEKKKVSWEKKTVTFSPEVDDSPVVKKEASSTTEASANLRKFEVR
jgi:hypothetical protein